MLSVFDSSFDKTLGVPDEELEKRFAAIIDGIKDESKIKGAPMQKYDWEKCKPSLEYPDGRRESIND